MQPKETSSSTDISRRITVDIDKAGLSEAEFDRTFKPSGAIIFFILLVILGLAIWFGIYFLMLNRV